MTAAEWEDFLRLHREAFIGVARKYAGAGEAEDVVQEALLDMLGGLDGFEGRSSLKTWAFRLLRNRAWKWARAQRRRREGEGAAALETQVHLEPTGQLEARSRLRATMNVLDMLPPKQKAALLLSVTSPREGEALAEEAGVTRRAFANQTLRARRALRGGPGR